MCTHTYCDSYVLISTMVFGKLSLFLCKKSYLYGKRVRERGSTPAPDVSTGAVINARWEPLYCYVFKFSLFSLLSLPLLHIFLQLYSNCRFKRFLANFVINDTNLF